MKLRRLDLLRYGHLTDAVLDFPEAALLHVVHGANEAGKSTALAAIADALFGFGHRTDYGFLHQDLRIGFTIAAHDGSLGSFTRRKGRRDPLRDADDNVVHEDTLRRFLGGISRDRFENSFGLDGARLRAGGQELQRLGGEVGESLLAGAGLLNLRAALTRLEDEAKSLVGDGRGRRRLSEAVEAWRAAEQQKEERSVVPRTWQETLEHHDEMAAQLSAVQEDTRTLSEESSRLQRVRRVATLLSDLADAREALAQVADAPHLPADAEARFDSHTELRREAERNQAREAEAAQGLAAMLAALHQDDAVLPMQDTIDALQGQCAVALQASADLEKVTADAAASRAKVVAAIDELGVPLAPEAAREALPPANARRAVQRLITQHATLVADQRAAARALADGEQVLIMATVALGDAPQPPSPDLLRRTIDAVRSEGRLDGGLGQARATLAEADTAAAEALAALPLWTADMAALLACKLPLPAESGRAGAQLDAASQAFAQARVNAGALADEITKVEEELARLARGEPVPTQSAVADARAERDRVWRMLRRIHEGASPSAEPLPDTPLPDAFEKLRDQADDLADRRADEAQRVADYLSTTGRRDGLRQRETVAQATLTAAEQASAQAEAAWRELWARAGLQPQAPAAMVEWRRARADVLRLAEAAASAQRHCNDLVARRDRALALLANHLPPVTAESLAARLLRAETACAATEAAALEHRKRQQALADAGARLPLLRTAVHDADAALDEWQRKWSLALAALVLPSEASVETADTALEAWAQIAQAAPAWRIDEGRIAEMNQSIGAFATAVGETCARLGEPLAEEAPGIAAARLARRLAEARKAASEAEELGKRIAAHEAATDAAAKELVAAEEALAALRVLAGTTDDASLAAAIERSRQRDGLTERLERTAQALRTQGDGLTEAVLRSEVADVEPDAVVGRLTEIGARLTELGHLREELSARRTKAEATLAELRAGHDAAAMAQQAVNAIADARHAAERYARLHVARVLLREGIDRFRKQQQDPLLLAAGTHFASLTDGRYVRLMVDYNAAGKAVLLAIRDTDVECPVEALSEGARDQLYLALRIAAIEQYASQAEPLPFIADDLLVHFDDVRAGAAISLLLTLGKTTQVILFTHHDHIVTLAQGHPGVVVQRMA